jgi:CheY-specific phosphatase CheX
MSNDLDPQQVLEQLTAAACQDLFARYGVAVKQVSDVEEPLSPDFLLCSVIGFSGRDLRGTLVLALTETLTGLSNPVARAARAAGAHDHDPAQRDWVGELSNQLLGRVKIELLRHGVEIYLNLPAVLRGKHLAPLPRIELKPLKFTLEGGAVAVWVEVETRPGFRIAVDGAADHSGPGAGDTLLFD